jgi:hypothetical protein
MQQLLSFQEICCVAQNRLQVPHPASPCQDAGRFSGQPIRGRGLAEREQVLDELPIVVELVAG